MPMDPKIGDALGNYLGKRKTRLGQNATGDAVDPGAEKSMNPFQIATSAQPLVPQAQTALGMPTPRPARRPYKPPPANIAATPVGSTTAQNQARAAQQTPAPQPAQAQQAARPMEDFNGKPIRQPGESGADWERRWQAYLGMRGHK